MRIDQSLIEQIIFPKVGGTMEFNKIFFQAGANGGVTGFGDLLAACDSIGVPVFAATSDSANLLYDLQLARSQSGVEHVGNFIPTTDIDGRRLDFDYTVYDSEQKAHQAWASNAITRWEKALPKVPPELEKDWLWISLENEQRPYVGWGPADNPDDPDWQKRIPGFTGWADCFGWQAYYTGLEAIRLGLKYTAFAFAGGNPEEGTWAQPGMIAYLLLCAQHPDSLGVALHEYSFTLNLKDGLGDKIGRFEQLLDTCDEHDIPYPVIHITEFGWAERDIPDPSEAMNQIAMIAAPMYAAVPAVKGAAIWTTQTGWSGLNDKVLRLVQPLQQFSTTWGYDGALRLGPSGNGQPDPSPNLLTNPSFEDGWYHPDGVPELQIPNGWSFGYATPETPNPIDHGQYGVWQRPEIRVMPAEQLPESERELFVLDGDYTLKAFKGHGAWYAWFSQGIPVQAGKQYWLIIRVFADLVKGYDANGGKIWADDGRDGLVRLFVNGQQVGDYDWLRLKPGQWNDLDFDWEAGEGIHTANIRLEFMCPFALANSGLFCDAWEMIELNDVPLPPDNGVVRPAEIRHTIHLLPQDTTLAELQSATNKLHPTRSAFTYSADVAHAVMYAGTPESKVVIWNGDRWNGDITAWFVERGITNLEYRNFDGSGGERPPIILKYRPCQTTRVTQYFGVNPDKYICCPGHDGIDYGVSAGLPFYAAQAGTVVHASDRRWGDNTASAYGWHVVVQHDGGYCTVYAHASPNLPVSRGQRVNAGQIVGYSGNTGTSTGYHLHFGLLVPYDSGNGYPLWIWGQPIDPYPYLTGLPAPDVTPRTALVGLHASADPGSLYGGTAEYEEFKTLRPGVIKVLSAHSEESVRRLFFDQQSLGNSPVWIVRAFLNFGGRTVSPSQFYQWTIDDTRRTVNALKSVGVPADKIWIELHNEPNLYEEGAGVNWVDGQGFGSWAKAVLAQYRNVLPDVKYISPGLSPGWSVANVRLDADTFLQGMASFISQCDGVGAHAYWQASPYPMEQAVNWVARHRDLYPGKPLWITEASWNQREGQLPTAVFYAEQYKLFVQSVGSIGASGVTFFVASASNGYFAPECWVVDGRSRGIAAAYVAL